MEGNIPQRNTKHSDSIPPISKDVLDKMLKGFYTESEILKEGLESIKKEFIRYDFVISPPQSPYLWGNQDSKSSPNRRDLLVLLYALKNTGAIKNVKNFKKLTEDFCLFLNIKPADNPETEVGRKLEREGSTEFIQGLVDYIKVKHEEKSK